MAKNNKKNKQPEPEPLEEKHPRLNWDSLNPADRREYLARFATEFQRFLAPPEDEQVGRRDILKRMKIESRQFDLFLKRLYKDGYLRLRPQRLPEQAARLKDKSDFQGLQGVVVVAGRDKDDFARAAAEDFIKRLSEIGQQKKAGNVDSVLNVGIVSGNTTGSVIRAACEMKWSWDISGVDASSLPKVQVFALNVCLTVPQHLPGNATVLAYQLAEKIAKEGGKAKGYGLSAPLMVEKKKLRGVDEAPQTREVLRFTEPARIVGWLRTEGPEAGLDIDSIKETDSELDVVLLGVGELPKGGTEGGGSIFYKLANDHGFDMDTIIDRERIKGDIAFTALRSDGTPVTLRKRPPDDEAARSSPLGNTPDAVNDEDGDEYIFYSAVQVHVLEAIAAAKDKSVILVARYSPGKDKVPAIFASIAGESHRYASRLIVDEETAGDLNRY